MDVLGSEGGGVSRIRDTVGEQCIGISLWDFPIRSLGPPQAPDWPFLRPVEHALRRGFFTPVGRCSCTSAQEEWRLPPPEQKFS